jgi:hypothetical protein
MSPLKKLAQKRNEGQLTKEQFVSIRAIRGFFPGA